jgi:rubredoxin
MRAYTCKECGYRYTEADKDWNYVNTKNPCPKCAFANPNDSNKNTKKIKFSVLAIIIFLITLGVLTNDNSAEYNVGLIAVIWLFTSTYVFPFITKEDMVG